MAGIHKLPLDQMQEGKPKKTSLCFTFFFFLQCQDYQHSVELIPVKSTLSAVYVQAEISSR